MSDPAGFCGRLGRRLRKPGPRGWIALAFLGGILFWGGFNTAESAESEPVQPKLAQMRIDESRCLPYLGPECGACASTCPLPGALVFDGIRPRIEAAQCTGCALCRQACVTDPSAIDLRSVQSG